MEKVCYKDVAILKYSNPDCEMCDNFLFLCAIDNSKQNFLDLETNEKVTLNEIYQSPFVEDKIETPVIEEKINYEKEIDAVYEQAQKNVEEITK